MELCLRNAVKFVIDYPSPTHFFHQVAGFHSNNSETNIIEYSFRYKKSLREELSLISVGVLFN